MENPLLRRLVWRITHLKTLTALSALVICLAALSGCGGSSGSGSGASRTGGSIVVTLALPQHKTATSHLPKSRVVPTSTQSVIISIWAGSSASGNPLQQKVFSTANAQALQSYAFAGLPPGAYFLKADAYQQVITQSQLPDTTDVPLAEGIDVVSVVDNASAAVGITMASALDHFKVAIADAANDNLGATVLNGSTSTLVPTGGYLVLSSSTSSNVGAVWTAFSSADVALGSGSALSLYNSGSATVTFTPMNASSAGNPSGQILLLQPASNAAALFNVTTGAALTFTPSTSNPLTGTLQVTSSGSASNITVAYTDGTSDGSLGSTVTENFGGNIQFSVAPVTQTLTTSITNGPPKFDFSSLSLYEKSVPPGFGSSYTSGLVASPGQPSISNIVDRTQPFNYVYTVFITGSGGEEIPVLQTNATYTSANNPYVFSGPTFTFASLATADQLPIDLSVIPATALIQGFPATANTVTVTRGAALTINAVVVSVKDPVTGQVSSHTVPVNQLTFDSVSGSDISVSAAASVWTVNTNANSLTTINAATDQIKFHFSYGAAATQSNGIVTVIDNPNGGNISGGVG